MSSASHCSGRGSALAPDRRAAGRSHRGRMLVAVQFLRGAHVAASRSTNPRPRSSSAARPGFQRLVDFLQVDAPFGQDVRPVVEFQYILDAFGSRGVSRTSRAAELVAASFDSMQASIMSPGRCAAWRLAGAERRGSPRSLPRRG